MLSGRSSAAIAVILTGLTDEPPDPRRATRLLEGASTAASVPSILGYIALATAGNELLRGKAAARFEGATLAGLGVGFIVAPKLFEAIGPDRVLPERRRLRRLVPHLPAAASRIRPGEVEAVARAARRRVSRYLRARPVVARPGCSPRPGSPSTPRSACGSASRSSSSRKANPKFPDQLLMRGFDADRDHARPRSASRSSSGSGCSTGATGSRPCAGRRSSCTGSSAAGSSSSAGLVVNHSGGLPLVVPIAGVLVAAFGLFVLAGATPAALGLLADISERFPADRGAIMGLYSVFLAIGQIIGSLIGGFAADWRGIDGMLIATFVAAPRRARPARPAAPPGARDRRPRVTPRRWTTSSGAVAAWCRPARARAHGAVVAPHHLATAAGLGILRAGGSAVDAAIATNAALAWSCPAAAGSAAMRSG